MTNMATLPMLTIYEKLDREIAMTAYRTWIKDEQIVKASVFLRARRLI